MANPIQLLFKTRDYGVGSITFDLILDENHNFSNDVTEHDVEDGTIISDHIKNNLINGSLTGFISNFTINRTVALLNVGVDRAQNAFDELENLWREKTLVTIVTVFRVYENVAITNISIPRNEDTGQSIVVGISFKQVNVVKLKTVNIDVSVKPRNTQTAQNRQSSPSTDVGAKTPTTNPTAVF